MGYKEKAIQAVRMMMDIDGYSGGDVISRRSVISILDMIPEEDTSAYTTIKEGGNDETKV